MYAIETIGQYMMDKVSMNVDAFSDNILNFLFFFFFSNGKYP